MDNCDISKLRFEMDGVELIDIFDYIEENDCLFIIKNNYRWRKNIHKSILRKRPNLDIFYDNVFIISIVENEWRHGDDCSFEAGYKSNRYLIHLILNKNIE